MLASFALTSSSLESPSATISFVDIGEDRGVTFVHAGSPTTEKYLHTLPEVEDAALNALSRARRRRGAAA